MALSYSSVHRHVLFTFQRNPVIRQVSLKSSSEKDYMFYFEMSSPMHYTSKKDIDVTMGCGGAETWVWCGFDTASLCFSILRRASVCRLRTIIFGVDLHDSLKIRL